MTDDKKPIDPKALDSLAVAPPDPHSDAKKAAQDAGQDESITRRLEKNPESKDARLDAALDESMDASDPPASTQPVHNHEPPPSSGYDPEAEAKRKKDA